MNYANLLKKERAEKVVKNAALFAPDSVEVKALAQVNARGEKLSDEDKVCEVYKVLGGSFLSEEQVRVVEEVKKSKKK